MVVVVMVVVVVVVVVAGVDWIFAFLFSSTGPTDLSSLNLFRSK